MNNQPPIWQLVACSSTLYICCHGYLLGLYNTQHATWTFGLVIPSINMALTTFTILGLLEVGKTILDPFGNDDSLSENLNISCLMAETNAGSVRWMNGAARLPFGDGADRNDVRPSRLAKGLAKSIGLGEVSLGEPLAKSPHKSEKFEFEHEKAESPHEKKNK